MALKVLLDGSKGKNEVRLFKNSAHAVLIQLVTVNFIQLGWQKKSLLFLVRQTKTCKLNWW